jgi:hypothetical protein
MVRTSFSIVRLDSQAQWLIPLTGEYLMTVVMQAVR